MLFRSRLASPRRRLLRRIGLGFLPLRWRLMLIGLIPLVIVLGLTSMSLFGLVADLAAADRLRDVVEIDSRVGDLVFELQEEGNQAIMIVGSPRRQRALLEDQLTRSDAAVARFMERHHAPAVSLAMAMDGRLVLARAYGHADKARKEPLAPRHRFRIASVSKPITATGILLLRERKYLRLSDKAFGNGALLGMPMELHAGGPSVTGITVEHLLTHAAGGWAHDLGFDPMFHHPGLDHAALIARVLREHPQIGRAHV